MQPYEYKVIPAPRRGKPGKGIRGGEAKFAHALSTLMNELGADGWEYIRADTLPVEERSGLTSRTTVYHNMLVFRRPKAMPEAFTEPTVEAPLALPTPALKSPDEGRPQELEDEVTQTEPHGAKEQGTTEPQERTAKTGNAIMDLMNARRKREDSEHDP